MFLQELKSRIAESHSMLEQNACAVAIMQPQVTLEDYVNYLYKMYGFVCGFEKIVYPVLIPLQELNIDVRRKIPLLQADLIALDCDTSCIPLIPANVLQKNYTNIAKALGGLYVMEGSVLGGAVIQKHLQKHLGELINQKTRYLTAYGQETGHMWTSLLNYFSNNSFVEAHKEIIIKSAVNTFLLINKWITVSSNSHITNEYQES